jgi:ribosomal protein L12E/L44/L45/RPP1/RPP2
MASKKETGVLRGAKLVKKATAAANTSGILASPEPLPTSLAKKMVLPNGESISAGMKELLTTDTDWIGIDYDDEEAEIEGMSLEDVVEEAFGEEAVAAFGEAYDMLTEDVVYFNGEVSRPACLYCGTPDDAGEYPVLQLSWENGVAKIGGFVPFDVWVAQELGALERGKEIGEVPAEYAALPKALADSNGDGRVLFTPKAGEATEKSSDDDEDEDDESGEESEPAMTGGTSDDDVN